jgi:hypothetical protein
MPRRFDATRESLASSCVHYINRAGLLLLFFGISAQLFASDRGEILVAIHMVENPTDSVRLGSKGELGPYQFLPTTWQMHTDKPFYLAANRQEADLIAQKHFDWITKGLERNGVVVTAYSIALVWNAGLSATIRGKVPRSSRNYATRVENTVLSMKAKQVAER